MQLAYQPNSRPRLDLANILSHLQEVQHAQIEFDTHLVATSITANILPLQSRSYTHRQCKQEEHETSTRFENFILGFQCATADAIDALLRNHKVPGDRPLSRVLEGEDHWYRSVHALIDEMERKMHLISQKKGEFPCGCFEQDLNTLTEIMAFLRRELDAILPSPYQIRQPDMTAQQWDKLKYHCRSCYLKTNLTVPGPPGWPRLKRSLAAVVMVMVYMETHPHFPMHRLANNASNSLWSLATVESLLSSHPMTAIIQSILPGDPCFNRTNAMRCFALYDIHTRLQQLMTKAQVRHKLQASPPDAKPDDMFKLVRQVKNQSTKLEGSAFLNITRFQLEGAMEDVYSASDHQIPRGGAMSGSLRFLKKVGRKSTDLAKSFKSQQRPMSREKVDSELRYRSESTPSLHGGHSLHNNI